MITIVSYPNNNLNQTINEGQSLDSNRLVKYLFVDVQQAGTDDYILITYNGTVTRLDITDECRYDPIDIYFQNMHGALQILTFFKARKESISVEREVFESDRGQPLLGSHQFVNYNVQARSKFTANTGFLQENMNADLKQLILSERLWVVKQGILTPINITSSNLEYKTRMNDRLINYEMEFTYSFNEINNI